MIFICRFVDGTVDTFSRQRSFDLSVAMESGYSKYCDRVVYNDCDRSIRITVNNICLSFKHIIYAYELPEEQCTLGEAK